MKKTIFLFLLISVICSAQKTESEINPLSPAAKEVYDQIIFTETEYYKFKEGKPANLYLSNEIAELSQIFPINGHGDYNGTYFIPNENDIKLWKDWFRENRLLFSFDDYDNKYSKHFQNKRRLIKFEYEKGKFRRNIPQSILDYIKEDIELLKNTDR
jgi:hypothetical protein